MCYPVLSCVVTRHPLVSCVIACIVHVVSMMPELCFYMACIGALLSVSSTNQQPLYGVARASAR